MNMENSSLRKSIKEFSSTYPDALNTLRLIFSEKLKEYGSIEHIDVKGRNVGLQASSRKLAYEMMSDLFSDLLATDRTTTNKGESLR